MEEALAERNISEGIHFCIRTLGGTNMENLPETDLTRCLRRLAERYGATIMAVSGYNPWGGTASPHDDREVGIKLTDGNGIYMYGACTLLFSSPQVTADGAVHAYACRDVDGFLTIGSLQEELQVHMLSMSNPAYRHIIEDQQNNVYGTNCQSCSMYLSEHVRPPAYV